jgi:hypothetical protein
VIGTKEWFENLPSHTRAAIREVVEKTPAKKDEAQYTKRLSKGVRYKGSAPPKPGDVIYIPGALYIDHGEDDVAGGMATVSEVETKYGSTFVSVAEVPGRGYNWASLREQQDRLAEEYKDRRAHPDPDYG